MLFPQILDQLAHLSDLVWIEAYCRLTQNSQVWFSEQRVRQSHPLSISLGQGPDQLVLYALETTKFFYVANTLSDPTMLDSLQGCAITQVLCYAHVAVEWHVFRHVAEMRSCLERLFKNIESRDGSATRGGWHEAGQNAHGGGFARTVGS